MSKENDIINILKKHSEGLRRNAIAKYTGFDKSAISAFMHNHTDKFYQDDNWCWHLKNMPIDSTRFSFKNDPVLCKLENQETAKTFTLNHFNSLADWSQSNSQRKEGPLGFHYTRDGKKLAYDSSYESDFLDYIKTHDLAISYGTQSMIIEYNTFFREKVKYYPDIVLLTKDHHIAIIEIKPCKFMSHHTNIEKYFDLQKYCQQNGYMFMMVDPEMNYMTFQEFRAMDVDDDLFETFEDLIEMYGFFEDRKKDLNITDATVNRWYEDFGYCYTKEDFRLQVHSMIVYHLLYSKSKYSFDVYNYPKK